MNWIVTGAFVVGLLIPCTAPASTVTVLGSTGGRIWYDGKDVGGVPLRLTAVPPGRHHIRVLTPDGASREFDLTYPAGQAVDRIVDLDVVASGVTRAMQPPVSPAGSGPAVSPWSPARDSVLRAYVDPRYPGAYDTPAAPYAYDDYPYASGGYPYGYDSYPNSGYPGYYGGSYYGLSLFRSRGHGHFQGGHSSGHGAFGGHHGSGGHHSSSSQHGSSRHASGGHRRSGGHHH